MLNATYPLVPFVTGTGQDMIFFILSPLGGPCVCPTWFGMIKLASIRSSLYLCLSGGCDKARPVRADNKQTKVGML